MSKSRKDSVDWRNGSESLLRAARADHDASAADYARVEAELARRVAMGASTKLAIDGDAPALATKSARVFTPGTIGKLLVGVSLLAAGSFAIVRTLELRQSPAARPTPALAPPPSAADSDARPRDTAPAEAANAAVPEPADPQPQPRARVRHETPARIQPSHGAPRDSEASKRSITSASADLDVADPSVSQPTASVDARASTPALSAQPAPSRSTPLKNTPAQPRAEAVVDTPPAASARTVPPKPTRPVLVDDSADARAELDLVERMQAAMRAGKPAAALELCAEHAKRWPRGTFIEEREAVSAIASCVLRSDDAASRARIFLSKHPHAPTAPRVVAACAPLSAATKPASSR